MKKTLLVVLAMVVTLAGCSKDEEVKQDPIIGKWKLISLNTYSNGEIEPYKELTDCEKKSQLEFKTDGSGKRDFYDPYNNECIGVHDVYTWSNKGNHTYEIKLGENEVQNTKITFEGNEMWIYIKDGGAEIDEVIVMQRME